MDTQTAFQIIYDLAQQNIIKDKEVIQDEEILRPIQKEQEEALNVVRDFIVNNIEGMTCSACGSDRMYFDDDIEVQKWICAECFNEQ